LNTRRRHNPDGVPSLNADPSKHERIAKHKRRCNESAYLRVLAARRRFHSRLIQNPDHERRQA